MFAGFRSWWTIPFSCAASSASPICFAIGSCFNPRERLLRDPLRQRLTVDQFHHKGGAAIRVFETVDRRANSEHQGGEHSRFPLEAGEPIAP